MNRDQRRALEKAYRKYGKSRTEAKQIARQMYDIDNIRLDGVGKPSMAKEFREGEKFKLDLEKIKARKNYERMTEAYKQFVNDNADTVLTAHVEHGLVSAKEEPKWLFWSGDLLKVEEEPEEESGSTEETKEEKSDEK